MYILEGPYIGSKNHWKELNFLMSLKDSGRSLSVTDQFLLTLVLLDTISKPWVMQEIINIKLQLFNF